MEKNEKRHLDLSSKIFEMGAALVQEGDSKEDVLITSTGNIMILVSGLLYDREDMHLFSELCNMFSAKKLVDSQMELGPLSELGEDELFRMIKGLRSELEDEMGDDNDDDNPEDQ
jgi:hypothetical protein